MTAEDLLLSLLDYERLRFHFDWLGSDIQIGHFSYCDCLERRHSYDSIVLKSKPKLCYDRRSVGRSVLVPSTHLGLPARFLLLSDNCGFVDVGRSLWRENGPAVYNCRWALPAQSFLGRSPTGILTIFYCLRFETPPTWKARSLYLYPPGTGWPSYTPRHWVESIVLLCTAPYIIYW
jgi:hypothetical protein